MRSRWARTPAWLVVVVVASLTGVSSSAGWRPVQALSQSIDPGRSEVSSAAGPGAAADATAAGDRTSGRPGAGGRSGSSRSASRRWVFGPGATTATTPTLPELGGPEAPEASNAIGGTAPTSDSCAPLPKPDGGTWTCTLDEQFTGTTLNRGLWVPQETATSNFHSGAECLMDSPNNISVGDGVLKLTARKEPMPFVCASRKRPFTTQYTGGQVSTFGTFSQKQGRFEMRARFPGMGIAGTQAAFWLWPADRMRWPSKEEIDITEIYSKYGDRGTPFVHYRSRDNVTSHRCVVGDLGQFHTYALEWTPVSLKFIYDGRTCLLHWIDQSPSPRGKAFNAPFMVTLSQFLGRKTNAFSEGRTPLPASTYVDYVRVWQ